MKKLFTLLALTSALLANAQEESNYVNGAITIGVVVEDMENSLKFYTEVLNFKEAGGFDIDSAFGSYSGLSNGVPFKVTILKTSDTPEASQWKLVSFNKSAQHPEQQFIQDDTGMQYMTLYVKNLDPIIKNIQKAGIPFLNKPNTRIRDGRGFILIQDPDGIFIELIGPMTK